MSRSGPEETRTPYLFIANEVFNLLNFGPDLSRLAGSPGFTKLLLKELMNCVRGNY